jgi:hypothetical protein
MKKILAAMLLMPLIASCVPSTPQARIEREPQKFEALGSRHQELVRNGQLARGMSQDAVYLAWGAPAGVFQGSRNGRASERWDYNSSRPVTTVGFHGGYGCGLGPYGVYGPYPGYGCYSIGPDVVYVPYRSASVWFVENRVDSWERDAR